MFVAPSGGRPLVGRSEELAALQMRRRELARRGGGVVLIAGPPGIGKSRLLAEFARTIGGGRAPVLVRTECLEFGGSTFGPIRETVAALAASTHAEIDERARTALERGTFFAEIERLVREATRKRGAIVCIEDLHWADPATLDFLAHLAPRIASDRLAIVATYRDDDIEARLDAVAAVGRITAAPRTLRLRLGPLAESEMRKLLASGERGGTPHADVLRDVVTRAAGNPLYAEELLRSALEGDGTLPLSIRGAVWSRLAALDDDDRRVLAHAAVLGYRFDPALLARTLACEPAAIERALSNARARRLVVEEPAASITFRFRDTVTHEAIAGRMLELEARALHVRVARMLESLPDAASRIHERAYHWWKARDGEHAIPACEAAGAAAMALHAYRDAENFYERALEFASDPAEEYRLVKNAAVAALAQGEHARARRYHERALAIEIAERRFSAAGETVRRVAGRLVYEGRSAEAYARLRTFSQTYGRDVSAVQALLIDGWPMLMDVGGGDPRGWLARRAAVVVPQSATDNERWNVLLLETNAAAYAGEIATWERCVEHLRACGNDGTAVNRVLSLATVAVTAAYTGGSLALARASIEAAYAACEDLGVPSFRPFVATADAFALYLAGDVRAAREAVRAALPDAGDANQRANVAAIGSLVALDLEDPELERLTTNDHMRALLEKGERSHTAGLAAAGIAVRLFAAGRHAEGAGVLERGVAALHTHFGAQFVLPLAARHVTADRARACIGELLAHVPGEDRAGRATIAMVDAVFAARDGRPDAVARARAAAERYDELGWELLRASALELAGETATAREIYLRCGSIRHVRRLRRGAVPEPVAPSPSTAGALTQRENEVASLVAAGLGNVEVAGRLGLSVKTVETHLSRIYARLGFRSRAQLGAFVATAANAAREEASPR